MTKPAIVYLTEDPSHEDIIRTINDEAFGPGRFARAAERVREQGPHDRRLSFVAQENGETIGSVRLTPIAVAAWHGHLLGPLAVRPSHKNRGIGRELVRISVNSAMHAGSGGVILVGDPPYYAPLGFKPLPPQSVLLPGPVDPRRVLIAGVEPAAFHRHGGGRLQWRPPAQSLSGLRDTRSNQAPEEARRNPGSRQTADND